MVVKPCKPTKAAPFYPKLAVETCRNHPEMVHNWVYQIGQLWIEPDPSPSGWDASRCVGNLALTGEHVAMGDTRLTLGPKRGMSSQNLFVWEVSDVQQIQIRSISTLIYIYVNLFYVFFLMLNLFGLIPSIVNILSQDPPFPGQLSAQVYTH